MIRFVVLLWTVILTATALHAQADTVLNEEQFVFPEFSVGVIRMKNGEKTILNLNYNLVTEKMVFLQDNQIFDIVNQSVIDTAFIAGRKFIPFGKVCYELAVEGDASLFIQHKGSVKRPPRPAAYGGTSQVSSSTYINNLKLGNDVYRKPDNSEIVIELRSVYWIRNNYMMNIVAGRQSLLRIFEDRKTEVKAFIRKLKFDAENPEHLGDLVNYYNSLAR